MPKCVLTYMQQSRHGLARAAIESALKACGRPETDLQSPMMQTLQGRLAAYILIASQSIDVAEFEPDVAVGPPPAAGTSDEAEEPETPKPTQPHHKRKN